MTAFYGCCHCRSSSSSSSGSGSGSVGGCCDGLVPNNLTATVNSSCASLNNVSVPLTLDPQPLVPLQWDGIITLPNPCGSCLFLQVVINCINGSWSISWTVYRQITPSELPCAVIGGVGVTTFISCAPFQVDFSGSWSQISFGCCNGDPGTIDIVVTA